MDKKIHLYNICTHFRGPIVIINKRTFHLQKSRKYEYERK